MNSNIFVIYGEINKTTVDTLNSMITNNFLSRDEKLKIMIDSMGGSFASGVRLMEIINSIWGHNVESYALGNVYSAATFPFLAAKKENRFVSRGALFLLHEPWASIAGNADELKTASDDLDSVTMSMLSIYIDKIGLPGDELSDIMKSDRAVSAAMAIDLGIAGGYLSASKSSGEIAARSEILNAAMASAVKKMNKKDGIMDLIDHVVEGQVKEKSEVRADRELNRVRGLTKMLGKGHDELVRAEIEKEDGVTAEELALKIVMSHKPQVIAEEDIPFNRLGELPGWERPQPQANSITTETEPKSLDDEVKSQYENDHRIRCAFGTMENYRQYVMKIGGRK